MPLPILGPSQLARPRPSFIIPANIILSVVAFAAAFVIWQFSLPFAQTHFIAPLHSTIRQMLFWMALVELLLVMAGSVALAPRGKNLFTFVVVAVAMGLVAINGASLIFGPKELDRCRTIQLPEVGDAIRCFYGFDYVEAVLDTNGITYTILAYH